MEPPKLEMPDDPIEGGKTDPIVNLKAGIIMLAMGIGVSVAHYVMFGGAMLEGSSIGFPFGIALNVLRIIFLALGPALIAIHFISRAYAREPEADTEEVE